MGAIIIQLCLIEESINRSEIISKTKSKWEHFLFFSYKNPRNTVFWTLNVNIQFESSNRNLCQHHSVNTLVVKMIFNRGFQHNLYASWKKSQGIIQKIYYPVFMPKPDEISKNFSVKLSEVRYISPWCNILYFNFTVNESMKKIRSDNLIGCLKIINNFVYF